MRNTLSISLAIRPSGQKDICFVWATSCISFSFRKSSFLLFSSLVFLTSHVQCLPCRFISFLLWDFFLLLIWLSCMLPVCRQIDCSEYPLSCPELCILVFVPSSSVHLSIFLNFNAMAWYMLWNNQYSVDYSGRGCLIYLSVICLYLVGIRVGIVNLM